MSGNRFGARWRGLLAGLTAFAAIAASPEVASAQGSPDLKNTMIDISYNAPANHAFDYIYLYLQKRKVLEELQQFLAPVRLPRRLKIQTEQCGQTNSWYEPLNGSVTVCYEWVDWVLRTAPVDKSPEGFSREDIVVGAFVQVVLHELSHAMFDMLDVPIFGREEDAADMLAGFVMTQLGPDVARRTLTGAAYFFEAISKVDGQPTGTAFSDEHGTDEQRFYNYLCVAYGENPQLFQDFIDKKLLPTERAVRCGHEYQVLRYAFVKTILPHIDMDLLAKVQSMQWLLPTDGK